MNETKLDSMILFIVKQSRNLLRVQHCIM